MMGRPVERAPLLEDGFWVSYGAGQIARQWRDAYAAIPSDPSDWQGAKAALQNADNSVSSLWPAKYLFDSPFWVDVNLYPDVGKEVALQRLARISAKLLLYRLDHGVLPAALPASGPDATDPFTGKPFKYRKAGKGFVVYSVGSDQVDQGGASSEPGLRESPDIVMSFN